MLGAVRSLYFLPTNDKFIESLNQEALIISYEKTMEVNTNVSILERT